MPSVLESIAFREPARARRQIASFLADLPEAIQDHIEVLLSSAADADQAVHYLSSLRQQRPEAFHRLVFFPPTLQYLIAVFSYSHFLSDETLQNPQWLDQLSD